MGDRTSVTLMLLLSQEEAAVKLFEFESEHRMEHAEFVYHSFYEVNYGDLPFLDALENAGIAFDSDWDSGDDYGPGCESCRFTADGSVIRKSVSNEYRNPSITALMEKINDYIALKEFIRKHHDEVSVPSWDKQELYGKVYRTKQLIAST
jgi:hypothetical protein